MSKTLVLKAFASALRNDFIAAIDASEAENIYFVIDKENRFFRESNFLKKIQMAAKVKNISIIYVVEHTFTRNLIKKLGFAVASKILPELVESELTLEYFLRPPAIETEPTDQKNSVEVILPNPFSSHSIRPSKKYIIQRAYWFFLLSFLGLGYVFLFWWFQPHATIVIKPKVSSASILQNIVIEMAQAAIPETDEELPTVQGILVRTTIKDIETISAGGRSYDVTNAYGQVTLFNETTEPKKLVPSRLEAVSGIIFRFGETVTIPARTDDGPGRLVVRIIADEYDEKGKPIGNRGNIIAGTELKFPALREELQELYYAKANKGPLVGGSTLTRYIVEEDDIDRAQGVVLENFRGRGIDELEKEVRRRSEREGGNQVLLENSALLLAEIKEFNFPETLIGTESQTFEVPAVIEVVGVVIDQAAIKKLMLKSLQKVIDEKQMIIALDDNSLEYKILDADNFTEQNWLKLSVKAIGIEQLNVETENVSIKQWKQKLIQPLLGQSIDNVRSRLLNDPDIDSIIDIRVQPFWKKNIPIKPRNVSIKILKVE